MSQALKIKSLYFKYREDMILKNVDFVINKGDFVSIIGPNGSGKSTLLKNIATSLRPLKGNIYIQNKDIYKYSAKELAKRMALVPQDTTMDYDFSVFDIVLMGRTPHLGRFQREGKKDYEITEHALSLTDTLHLKDRSISEISGGERQRVVIARALAQQPDIILLDEPTSHLDINHKIEILALLKKLNKEKRVTIILVIHDINLSARFSDKMILLNQGEVISIGKPDAVITQENIRKAYGIDTMISHNLYTNSPYIIPLINSEDNISIEEDKSKDIRTS